MRIGISNLAWECEHDPEIAAILLERGIDAIDVVPARYFSDIRGTTDSQVAAVRRNWGDLGIEIHGMQSLLFGIQGLNIFGSAASQERMLEHLDCVCRMGAILGASRMTFGSPKSRDLSGWPAQSAQSHAIGFFDRLANVAAQYDVCICLEPNPVSYQCNFMTTTDEAAAIVRAVKRPQILLQLDTGTLAVNGEDAPRVISAHSDIVGHIHASEPSLAPLGTGTADHPRYGALIRSSLPGHVVTIEMLPGRDRPGTVRRALDAVLAAYGDVDEERTR